MDKLLKLFDNVIFLICFWIFAMLVNLGIIVGIIWLGAKIVKAVWS